MPCASLPSRSARPIRRNSGLLAGALLALALTTLVIWHLAPKATLDSAVVTPTYTARTNLMLVAGRLCRIGETNAFAGLMVEYGADGSLRSRSAVSNGVLEGLSEGWHTNGQLQVTEYFRAGVSHGRRTKWYASGAKLSEGEIVGGQFHGIFRRWHECGTLAEQVEMAHGQPDGLALAYFESGFLKTRVALKAGKVTTQTSWNDGEHKEAPASFTASTSPGSRP